MSSERLTERTGRTLDVSIEFAKVTLEGILTVPEKARGIVLFAHGSGSSRFSPRNRYVAGVLQSNGFATLLLDLLTQDEERIDERTLQLRFNIRLLAKRLCGATGWTTRNPELRGLNIGYFGASTGAAAALMASAQLPEQIAAIVSRGGRPDLAGDYLKSVRSPTLLVVGGNDGLVIELNRNALAELGCNEKNLVIVPGATHLFEEPGTLEEVARISSKWFEGHFDHAADTRTKHSPVGR